MPAINENLKLLRQANGMTQADVAEIISVTRQTVSSYESGRTQPDIETLKRLADVYRADLHDVLYGGNQLQRKLRHVKLAAVILAVVMLLGILTHSVLFWILNTFYVHDILITPETMAIIEMRFAVRDVAERVAAMCTAVFWIGCVAMIYPFAKIAYVITFRKILIYFSAIVIAMFACVIPFAVADRVFTFTDYLLPIWRGLPAVFLLFIVTLVAKYLKHRHNEQEQNI